MCNTRKHKCDRNVCKLSFMECVCSGTIRTVPSPHVTQHAHAWGDGETRATHC